MAHDINKVLLSGRIEQHPYSGRAANGNRYVMFTLHTDCEQGQGWHPINCWEETQEWASRHLGDGSYVTVAGVLTTYKSAKYGQQTSVKALSIKLHLEDGSVITSSDPDRSGVPAGGSSLADVSDDEEDLPF